MEGANVDDSEYGDGPLYRRGSNDSKNVLERQSAAAEKAIGIHGVSVSASPAAKPGQIVRRTSCSLVEAAGFRVTQTGNDPNHHTVELPKPITSQIVSTWNELFK